MFRLVGGDGGSASAGANGSATPHPYLIETNPALTQLGNFLSSNYLLGLLGYDTDAAQRRLGDGLYEQRLVRDAVVARTGQRYLAGLNSDEAMFRYLMDNAIAAKDALQLSVGVSLSPEQVAALTHDIVWMEERVVAGENVLVPVLYLAQGEGRLAPTGALIQGRDLTLIAGETLANRGTLRATENLGANAVTVLNTGLMQAGERLSVLATDSVVNTRGGILAGRTVDIAALVGDIINERSVTQYAGNGRGITVSGSVVDAGSRIEAADSLSISAGRDLYSIGSTLTAGGDLDLAAGRHLVIASAEDSASRSTVAGRYAGANEQVTQFGSTVSAGGTLTLVAGADLAVTASRLEAGGDAMLLAGRDLTLSAAADMAHDNVATRGNRSFHRETLTVRQQAAEVQAGGNLTLAAGQDLTLVASAAQAGGEAYLYAGRDLALLAAQDQDYFLYDKKKKGSLGGKQTRRDEITTVTQVGSRIEAGGNLTLESGEDQRYQVASLKSGADLTLDAGGDIRFEGVKDLKQENHEKSSSSWAWTSMKGKGSTDETLRQSELVAAGKLVIEAAGKIRIDIPEVNQQTVSQTIAALVETEPQLAWLKEMESRGDIDWQRVKEVHDQWKYSHSGMGQVLGIVVAIVVTALTWGWGATLTGATTGTATAAASNAVVSAVVSNAAVNTINSGGDLGKALEQTFSEEAIKGYMVSALTAGLTQGATNYLQQEGFLVTDLGKASFSERLAVYATKATIGAGVQSVVLGKPLEDTLKTALVTSLAQTLTSEIGDWGRGNEELIAKTLAHAAVQCAAAAVQGADCGSAAIGAATAELLSPLLDDLDHRTKEAGFQQSLGSMVSGLGAALVAGLTGKDPATAVNAAQMVEYYNRQLHPDERKLIKELAKQKAIETCNEDANCINAQTIRWTDALERVAESRVDDKEFGQSAGYLAALERAAQIPASEGAMGSVAAYLDDLQTANEMLAPYVGKPILVNGQAEMLNGAPQTYFSATAEQRANTAGNYFLGSPPASSIIWGMADRDLARLKYAETANGSAQPVYPLEEAALGGMVSERILGVLGRIWTAKRGGWSETGGSGPVSGTIGITDQTSVAALRNYYPKGGGVEFVYDPTTNTFVTGRPAAGLFQGSAHQQLAQSIGAADRPVVGGTLQRGANGEFITTENSGHYGQNWTESIRQQFQTWLNGRTGMPVNHQMWRY